jgi:hypothetical protein
VYSTINQTNNIDTYANDSAEYNSHDFIKLIYKTKPAWYKESTWVKKKIIFDEYNNIYDTITKKSFALMFKDKIYKSEKRQTIDNKRHLFVKLFSRAEMVINGNTAQPIPEQQKPTQLLINHIKVSIKTDHNYKTLLHTNIVKDSKWVYFIYDGTNIKVGKTKNLKQRLSALQTGNANKLCILAYIETGNMNTLEKQFHRILAEYSVCGEWFKLDQTKMVEMLQRCRHGQLSYY